MVNENNSTNSNYCITSDDALLLYLVIVMLYTEGIEPTRAEIMFKLKEFNAVPAFLNSAINYYRSSSQWYDVIENDNIIIHLKKTPEWFKGWVNLKSPINIYSADVWISFIDYVTNEISSYGYALTKVSHLKKTFKSAVFNHTRYALSKFIKIHGPEIIKQLRIGDIAHLIQLAIYQDILKYECATIVPVALSDEIFYGHIYTLNITIQEKQQITSILKPKYYAKYDIDADFLAGIKYDSFLKCELSNYSNISEIMETSRNAIQSSTNKENIDLNSRSHNIKKLEQILKEILNENDKVLMSQIRSIIYTRYKQDIKPVDYGFNKLSDLLNEQFSHICRLVCHRNRHVYLEKATSNCNGNYNSNYNTNIKKLGFKIYQLAHLINNFSINAYSRNIGGCYNELNLVSLHTEPWSAVAWNLSDLETVKRQYENLLRALIPQK